MEGWDGVGHLLVKLLGLNLVTRLDGVAENFGFV